VIATAASETRKATTPATSSGTSERGNAWRERASSNACGGRSPSVNGVRVNPGATQLTVMPWAPSGLASDRAMPIRAALLTT
jgi:hypothetical protein